jgi:hypothetical protein
MMSACIDRDTTRKRHEPARPEQGVSLFLAFADDEAAMGLVDAALNAMSPGEGGGGRTAVETYEVLLDESR